ncbi:MAG: hypothetical protein HYZ48_05920 [Chlamydiales bacterium]|nr:hypothetical protein [Chlamydiales bacterium]
MTKIATTLFTILLGIQLSADSFDNVICEKEYFPPTKGMSPPLADDMDGTELEDDPSDDQSSDDNMDTVPIPSIPDPSADKEYFPRPS